MSDPAPIIIITGPSLVGKTLLCSELEKIMKAEEMSTLRLVRATTRHPRKEEVDRWDYKFVDDETMEEMVRQGKIIAPYSHSGSRYGITKESLDAPDYKFKLVTIGNTTGLAAALEDLTQKVIPVFIYADNEDISQRITQKLRDTRALSEHETTRLSAFDKELPIFKSMARDFRYILFNPNRSGVSAEDTLSHLALRLFDAIQRSGEEPALSDNDFRTRYVESLVHALCGMPIDDLIRSRKNARITFNKNLLQQYRARFGHDVNDLEQNPIIGVSKSYGIFSIYIHHNEEEKKHLLALLEKVLGVPQYRYEAMDAVQESPMSLTSPSGLYSNFYASFSAAYDPFNLSRIDAPAHTLVIEGVVGERKPKEVYTLEPRKAEEVWERRKDIIRRTSSPITRY